MKSNNGRDGIHASGDAITKKTGMTFTVVGRYAISMNVALRRTLPTPYVRRGITVGKIGKTLTSESRIEKSIWQRAFRANTAVVQSVFVSVLTDAGSENTQNRKHFG
jgi:hypothetical protein